VEVEADLVMSKNTTQLEVAGDAPLAETRSSNVANIIDEKSIDSLPLNGRRFSDLALLTPGVNQDPRGLTSGSNGDLSAGGIRGFQSSFLVDGTDNNNGFFSQARGRYRAPYQFSNDVVQEFRVSTKHLRRGNRSRRGRRHQCRHQVRIKHVSRKGLLLSARQQLERAACLRRI
jgi:hypothetical protein